LDWQGVGFGGYEVAYCLQERYGSGVSDEDDFALGIS
jgi:hypothetical protein